MKKNMIFVQAVEKRIDHVLLGDRYVLSQSLFTISHMDCGYTYWCDFELLAFCGPEL